MTAAYNIANGWSTTLAWSLTDVATTVDVSSTSGIPARPFQAVILAEGANTDEIVTVTDLSGSTITITRATEENSSGSSSASAHASGAVISHVLTAATLKGGWANSTEATSTVADSDTAQTLDLSAYTVFDITLTDNCTFTFSNPPAAGDMRSWTLIIRQDGTGGRTVTWPTITWQGGAAPSLAPAGSAITMLTVLTDDGGSTYYGSLASGGGYTSAVPWSSGTSMPGSPVTGERITRTDLGLDFYYDGTRWLSVTLYRENMALGSSADVGAGFTTTAAVGRWGPWSTTYDLYLVTMYVGMYVVTTNDGTKYWTMTATKYNSALGSPTTVATANTSAQSANTWTMQAIAINALLNVSTYVMIETSVAKTSTPGALAFPALAMTYRLVGT